MGWNALTPAEQWDVALKVAGFVLTLVTAILGLMRYFSEQAKSRSEQTRQQEKDREQQESDLEFRREELAWRRTQFIFELAQNLDTDECFRKALEITTVETHIPTGSSLKRILGDDLASLTTEEKDARYAIDRYLDFFDRLYLFVVGIKSLTVKDISCFEGYLTDIRDISELREYAETQGCPNVITLANLVDDTTPNVAKSQRHRRRGLTRYP